MAVFVVIPTAKQETLDHSINTKFATNSKKLPRGEWLVSFSGTAQELSDHLGITPDGSGGHGVVVAVTTYYGHAPTDIWEWIKTRWQK